jgi:hypothetical protein
MNSDHDYVPLRTAAERVYRELTGYRSGAPLGPAFLDAASAALSVVAAIRIREGEHVIHRGDLEVALQRLRRAGVCFSEVRQT